MILLQISIKENLRQSLYSIASSYQFLSAHSYVSIFSNFFPFPSYTPEYILIETRYRTQVRTIAKVTVTWYRKRKVSHGTNVTLNQMQDQAG
jgi:hypothetical protein